jgi:hypothetical protein
VLEIWLTILLAFRRVGSPRACGKAPLALLTPAETLTVV